MLTSKVIVMFAMAMSVVMATEVDKQTTNTSIVQHVGSLLTAKARLFSMNITANVTTNVTEPNNSTEKIVTKRSVGIDRSEGISTMASVWWRIPTAIWQFINQIIVDPVVSSLRRLLSVFGLDAEQIIEIPLQSAMQSSAVMNLVNQFMPQMNAA